MARLASVVKQGYFPAPPEAVAGILRHLKIPDPPADCRFKAEDVNILDPCAGEAKALAQVAEGLGVSPGHAFAVELNARRAAVIAETHPEIRLLGPCGFEAILREGVDGRKLDLKSLKQHAFDPLLDREEFRRLIPPP